MTTDTPPLLEVDDLTVRYRVDRRRLITAVEQTSIRVEPGELVSVVGESGSGKTTLVHATLGLLPPAAHVVSGRIRFSDIDVTRWSDRRLSRVRGSYVSHVPQDPGSSLNPTKRVVQQVLDAVLLTSGGVVRRRPSDKQIERARESMRRAGLTDIDRVYRAYPHELSGGMKQRALIAVALAGSPKLLVADEPTSALDVTVARTILDHLVELREQLGLGILLVTHDLGIAADRSDRLVVMERGRVVEQGPVERILAEPSSEYTARLLESAPARSATRLAPAVAARPPKPGPAIEVEGLRKAYGAVVALDGVELSVRRGSTHAIVGESGAGKSTLARALTGFVTPDAGSVTVAGHDAAGLSAAQWRAQRRDLQFVYQNPYGSLDPRFTVRRLVAEPLRALRIGTRTEQEARVVEVLEAVGLGPEFLGRRPAQLSGGQRQRVAIARALAPGPEIVVNIERRSDDDEEEEGRVSAIKAHTRP